MIEKILQEIKDTNQELIKKGNDIHEKMDCIFTREVLTEKTLKSDKQFNYLVKYISETIMLYSQIKVEEHILKIFGNK